MYRNFGQVPVVPVVPAAYFYALQRQQQREAATRAQAARAAAAELKAAAARAQAGELKSLEAQAAQAEQELAVRANQRALETAQARRINRAETRALQADRAAKAKMESAKYWDKRRKWTKENRYSQTQAPSDGRGFSKAKKQTKQAHRPLPSAPASMNGYGGVNRPGYLSGIFANWNQTS
jgi:hypothetical protein